MEGYVCLFVDVVTRQKRRSGRNRRVQTKEGSWVGQRSKISDKDEKWKGEKGTRKSDGKKSQRPSMREGVCERNEVKKMTDAG